MRKQGGATIPVVLGSFFTLVLSVQPGTAEAQGRTVWDGVYNAGQADRGRSQFGVHCSGCHESSERRLDGAEFLQDWGEDNLISLFDMISNSMPARDPGSLTDETYLDIVTYLLEMNGFPEGDDELAIDALATIRVESEDGPGLVPDFSLVEVAGCLSESPDGEWIITSATTPVRTRDPAASSEEDLQAKVDDPPGSETFELIYVFPAPVALVGQKIEAKGFLIRGEDPDQINVSSLASIAGDCL